MHLWTSLVYFGKRYGFYQLNSVSLSCAAAAVRAARVTVGNWRCWFDFLHSIFYDSDDFSPAYYKGNCFSPSFWDAPPFAVNLYFAYYGKVFHQSIDFSKVILRVIDKFKSGEGGITRRNLQKSISLALTPFLYPFSYPYPLPLLPLPLYPYPYTLTPLYPYPYILIPLHPYTLIPLPLLPPPPDWGTSGYFRGTWGYPRVLRVLPP